MCRLGDTGIPYLAERMRPTVERRTSLTEALSVEMLMQCSRGKQRHGQSHMRETYLVKTTNLGCTVYECLAAEQALMLFVLEGLEINHTLDNLPVIIDETADRACKCVHHLWCSPCIGCVGDLGCDCLEVGE